VDAERLAIAAEHYVTHSPTYPSVGSIFLGFACLHSRAAKRVPVLANGRAMSFGYRLAADGTEKVQCAELVVRLLADSGTEAEFVDPAINQMIGFAKTTTPQLSEQPQTPRIASSGTWPAGVARAARYALAESIRTLRARHASEAQRDYACLVMSSDFEASPSFETIYVTAERPRRRRSRRRSAIRSG